MTKPITISNTFAGQTGPIPLSQLDTNFTQVSAAINDPATYQNYVVDTGAANAYVVAPNPVWTAYAAGMQIQVLIAAANTTASTINVSGLGIKSITNPDLSALSSNQLTAGVVATLIYDGTQFQLPTSYASGTFSPGFSFGGGFVGMTFTRRAGFYTKIGNRVIANGVVQLSAKGSSTGTAVITALPFTSNNTANNECAVAVRCANLATTPVQIVAYLAPNSTVISLENLGVAVLADTDFSANTYFSFNLSYFV